MAFEEANSVAESLFAQHRKDQHLWPHCRCCVTHHCWFWAPGPPPVTQRQMFAPMSQWVGKSCSNSWAQLWHSHLLEHPQGTASPLLCYSPAWRHHTETQRLNQVWQRSCISVLSDLLAYFFLPLFHPLLSLPCLDFCCSSLFSALLSLIPST